MLLGEIANSRGFKIAALNIGSLPAHMNDIRLYMNSQTIDILALNERDKQDKSISNCQMYISDYIFERKDRNRNCEGVARFIRNTINCELMHELNDDQLEWFCVKVSKLKLKLKYFIVGTSYKHSTSTAGIMKSFKSIIDKLEIYDHVTNVLGDFNCNAGGTS